VNSCATFLTVSTDTAFSCSRQQLSFLLFVCVTCALLLKIDFVAMQKKFVRGLKQHGKNFFKIRRDLLYNKETVSCCFSISDLYFLASL